MSSKVTGFLILLKALFSTATAGGKAPGYFEPDNGVVWPWHVFAPRSFHSEPLVKSIGNIMTISNVLWFEGVKQLLSNSGPKVIFYNTPFMIETHLLKKPISTILQYVCFEIISNDIIVQLDFWHT